MKDNSNEIYSGLRRARGLGSAKEGTNHWWLQRVTALALTPLTIWLIWSLISLTNYSYLVFRAWVGQPFQASCLILFFLVAFHHSHLGMQVVVEDYVSNHFAKILFIIFIKFICYSLAIISVVSVLTILIGAL